jgi:hypothetical protein
LYGKEVAEMPKGNPSRQTIATEKYAKKAGLVSKSYKLHRDVVDGFARACETAGVSQSGKLTEMMIEFTKKVAEGK